MRYMKYYDLMSILLFIEKHNELLLKNHEEHPITTFPCKAMQQCVDNTISHFKEQEEN